MATLCFALLLSLVTAGGGSADDGSGSGSGSIEPCDTTILPTNSSLPATSPIIMASTSVFISSVSLMPTQSIMKPSLMIPTLATVIPSHTIGSTVRPRTSAIPIETSELSIYSTFVPRTSEIYVPGTSKSPITATSSTASSASLATTEALITSGLSSAILTKTRLTQFSSSAITQTPRPTLQTISLSFQSISPTFQSISPTLTIRTSTPTAKMPTVTSTTLKSPSVTSPSVLTPLPTTAPGITPGISPVMEEEGGEGEGTPKEQVLFLVSAVGGAFVVLLLLVVIILGVLTYRNRRNAKRRRAVLFSNNREMVQIRRVQSTADETTPNHRPAPCGVAKQPQKYEELFSHIAEESLPIIEVRQLQEYVEALEEDQAMDEYLEVLEMDVQPYTMTASLKCNKSKNRYVDILANEFTRVHLQTPAGHTRYSDYINANYVEGYSRRKEYIAAQGPLEKTGADFWSMVWSEKSAIIVMVTNLFEDQRLKCFKYWPSEGALLAHSLSVVLQDEQILPNYTIRSFKVTLKDQRYDDSGESRLVTQFHFTGWPDHGVPESTDSMLEFVSRVRSDILPSHGPLISHCSAGVGRTGTFIALDVMLQKLEHNEALDIMNWVCRMRAQRGSMVQTSLQYMFIYKALAHAAALRSSGEASGMEEGEEGEGDKEGGGKGVEENHKTLSESYQMDWEEDDGLMSLPSFSSDDFLDMHVV